MTKVQDMKVGRKYLVDDKYKTLVWKSIVKEEGSDHHNPTFRLVFLDGTVLPGKSWDDKFTQSEDNSPSFGGKKTRRKIKKRKPKKSRKARKSAQKSRR